MKILEIDEGEEDEYESVEEVEQEVEQHEQENFTTRYFLTPLARRPDNSSNDGDGNRTRDISPGVERINGIGMPNRVPGTGRFVMPAPQAYPVYPVTIVPINNTDPREQQEYTTAIDRDGSDEVPSLSKKVGKAFCYFVIWLIMVMSLSFLGIRLKKWYSTTGPENPNNYNSDYSSKPTLPPSSKIFDSSPTESLDHSKLQQQNNSIPDCFHDPWEIYILEEIVRKAGTDTTSFPRKYHICPNTHINIQKFDYQLGRFDINTGDYTAFLLFLPNVSIKCGFDGSFDNNCTLNGGLHSVLILDFSTLESHVDIGVDPENVTIEGFRFTGIEYGVNIANYANRASLTLVNCHFDNNYNMFASIMTASMWTTSSTLKIHNCTFENNVYKYSSTFLINTPSIGVITTFIINNTNAVVNNFISDTTFKNNTFLFDDEPETLPSLINQDFTPDEVLVNSAVINLMSVRGILDVTDSCFVGNNGYTKSLILMDDGNNRTVLQNSYGNFFAENESSEESSELSCILLHQNTSYNEYGFPMGVIGQKCSDHFLGSEDDNNNRTNPMCLI